MPLLPASLEGSNPSATAIAVRNFSHVGNAVAVCYERSQHRPWPHFGRILGQISESFTPFDIGPAGDVVAVELENVEGVMDSIWH
jgi:hypothetical protein